MEGYLRISVLFIIFSLTVSTQAQESFYGSKTQEAYFTLQGYTYFNQKPSETTIQNDVRNKTKYIMGYMRRTPENHASIYPAYKITTLKVELVGSRYRVTYKISGKGIFLPGNADYTFLIPIIHGTLYAKSQGRCTRYPNETTSTNFWYYWDPFVKNCPLVENTDYLQYTAALTYINNTQQTYPEYARLFVNGYMRIANFFGLQNYNETNWNPNKTKDITAQDYKHQRDELTQRYGMSSRVWSEAEVRQYYNPSGAKPIPYIEEFSRLTPQGLVTVTLFYGNTGMNHDSRAFHIFFKKALNSDQVIIYNGHSGLGKNLYLPDMEADLGSPIKLNSGYQIYFLGSCIPYAYYTNMFFQRKVTTTDPNGTKNLDLISFGDESIFGNHYDDRLMRALFDYADNIEKHSYQKIIGTDTYYHFAVSGDEDNPILP